MSRGKWKKENVKEKAATASIEPVVVQVKESKSEETGIVCPLCRFPMRVCRTKPLNGAVYRVRVCDRCGHKKPTTED